MCLTRNSVFDYANFKEKNNFTTKGIKDEKNSFSMQFQCFKRFINLSNITIFLLLQMINFIYIRM